MSAISPLRYPGGKARLVPLFSRILERKCEINHYIELYAGGAAVALDLLVNGRVRSVSINDKDPAICHFWSCCMNDTESFCKKVYDAHVNIKTWENCKAIISDQDNHLPLEVGFAFFFLNRVNRSGIVSGGVIGGIRQSGKWKMGARYNKKMLVERIQSIAPHHTRVNVSNEDAIQFLKKHKFPRNALIYCDPPYFANGKRLYMNYYTDQDHKNIARYMRSRKSLNWIISYDAVPQILDLYTDVQQFDYALRYSANQYFRGREIMFFSPAFSAGDVAAMREVSSCID